MAAYLGAKGQKLALAEPTRTVSLFGEALPVV